MTRSNTHRRHEWGSHAILALLGLVFAGCACEWVSDRSEIERYELESAKKICRRWAQEQVEDEESAFGRPRAPGSGWPYQSYFSECMRKHGWTRVPKGQTEEAEPREQAEQR